MGGLLGIVVGLEGLGKVRGLGKWEARDGLKDQENWEKWKEQCPIKNMNRARESN